MAANPLIFKNAEKVRDSITESQKKDISNLYNDWANEIGKMADYYSHKTTASAPLSERYYKELQKQLYTTSREVSNEVYKQIKSNMYTVSDAVVSDNVNWLKQFGFSEDGLNAAFSYVPDSIVRSIVTGQVYESGWSLSSRIWGNNEDTMRDLYRIVAGGVAQQMPIKDIAKQLEGYVRPSAAKQWNLVDQDGKRIYPKQVDYNAQRLARTLVQHSYQQSFDAVNHNNPFVIDYIWRANGSRVCELCMDRDGRHYDKDVLPLDHPNGMCTMEPNIDDNMDDKLVEWFNSENGTFPEIDEFAKEFGYETSKIDSKPSTWQEWSKTVPFEEWKKFSREAKKAGMTFDEYYKVYTGQTSSVTTIVNNKSKVTKDVKKVVEKVTEVVDKTSELSKEWVQRNCVSSKMFINTDLTEKDKKALVEIISNPNVSDNFKKAFARSLKQQNNWTANSKQGSYFRASTNSINLSKGDITKSTDAIGPFKIQNGYSTIFHEMGHSIDNLKNGFGFNRAYSESEKFQGAMIKDLDNLRMKLRNDKTAKEELIAINKDGNSRGVQDIFGGSKFLGYTTIGNRYNWSHDDNYWKRSNVKAEMASELFAHISAAQVSEAEMKYIDKYFPETKKEFDKIIAEVAKGVK